MLNLTAFGLTKKDYIPLRYEYWRDERGMRSGFLGSYTSNATGWTHNFNSVHQIRPEISYYLNWTNAAFDLGTRQNMVMYGLDMTLRF